MGLVDRFNQLVARLRPAATVKTTADEVRKPSATISSWRGSVGSSRREVVRDCRAMYEDDPRARGVIATLARDAVKGGFVVQVADARAQAAADDLMKRLKLMMLMDDWVRLTLRDGDSFLELAVGETGLVESVTRKPTLEMHRHSDKADRFAAPERAFWCGEMAVMGDEPPGDAIWFADWQMIHARWDHDEGSRYGRPLFASARKSYRRMSEGETDIAVRRKTRAGMKFVHTLEGADEAAIEAYKERNRDVIDNPFAAVADFFTNKPGSIEVIQGDARLGEIADVIHHVETWAVASPVPMALLGYGADLNRDILEQKLEQYQRALEPVTDWVTDQLVIPLLERQWLLLGIWPGGLDYDVQWASKAVLSATDLRDAADAGVRLRVLGWPDEVVARIMAPLIPGLDLEGLLGAMSQQQPDEVGRMARLGASPKSVSLKSEVG